jgi:hypothetical protein
MASSKHSSTQSGYRIEASRGHFAVLHTYGIAEYPFASRRQASVYIKSCVTEDNLLQDAKQFIGVATNGLMRKHSINRETARLWIREAVDSRD